MAGKPDNMMQMLAHHDAAIGGLSSRIGHVEKTLVDHGTVLHRIENAVTKQDARPTFDFHKTVSTVVAIAILFSMICGGIIYIASAQNASIVAEQKSFNQIVAKTLDRHDGQIERLSNWATTVVIQPKGGR